MRQRSDMPASPDKRKCSHKTWAKNKEQAILKIFQIISEKIVLISKKNLFNMSLYTRPSTY
ncbi:MAG: hypothetical protein KAS75_08215 [Planctomycetes bacterium]|nr:hypothetical protein [Planctomycetota bacterium]